MAFDESGNYADKVPYTFTVIKEMQEQTIKTHPFLCLFDSGSDITWIHQRVIPRHIKLTTSERPCHWHSYGWNIYLKQ